MGSQGTQWTGSAQAAEDIAASIEEGARGISAAAPQLADVLTQEIEGGAREVEKQVTLGPRVYYCCEKVSDLTGAVAK